MVSVLWGIHEVWYKDMLSAEICEMFLRRFLGIQQLFPGKRIDAAILFDVAMGSVFEHILLATPGSSSALKMACGRERS